MLGFTIVWGQRLYGRVDQVPGLCWVSTEFFHLWYLPLIPLRTFAVLAEDHEGWRGPQIEMSSKSVLVGYLRGACVAAAIAGLILVLISQASGHSSERALLAPGVGLLLAGAALLAASLRARSINVASYERACELGRDLGVTAEGQAIIDLAYGKIDAAKAKAITDLEDSIADGNFEPSDEQPIASFGAAGPPLTARRPEGSRTIGPAVRPGPAAPIEHDEEPARPATKDEPTKDEPRRAERPGKKDASKDEPKAKAAPTKRADVIKFRCPYCKEAARVPASLAGKQGKCKGCRKVIEVPSPLRASQG